ncbi:MAG: histidine phosphatase family protein [Candidatus Omnitrophica bacterium]|nr:histidine phosphatase family protein [Candidatus Omnitrophota bacterium]
MTKIFLLRHGQTDFSLERKYCGSLDVDLNDEGRKQALKIARYFQGAHFDAVYSSDLQRAFETAAIAFENEKIVKQNCFREMDFGVLEGLKYEEAMKNYSQIYEAWIHAPWDVKIPNGEAFIDFCHRVMDGLSSLLSHHRGQSIAVVSHGGPIRVILCDALKRGVKDFWSIQQDNAALNVIEYPWGQDPVVTVMNETAYLNG